MKALRIEKMQELAENRHKQLALEAEMKIAEAKAYGEKKAELEVQAQQKQVELDALFQQKKLEMQFAREKIELQKKETEIKIAEAKALKKIEVQAKLQTIVRPVASKNWGDWSNRKKGADRKS